MVDDMNKVLGRNFLSVDKQISINSYGDMFYVGDVVKHDDDEAGIGTIESFEIDESTIEVRAITEKGWAHVDFISKENTTEHTEEDSCGLISTYGTEEIKRERIEQIEKHGFSTYLDSRNYAYDELLQASFYCMYPDMFPWPDTMDVDYADRIKKKGIIERLSIAGAFIAAEIDKIKYRELTDIKTVKDLSEDSNDIDKIFPQQ